MDMVVFTHTGHSYTTTEKTKEEIDALVKGVKDAQQPDAYGSITFKVTSTSFVVLPLDSISHAVVNGYQEGVELP